MAFSPHARLPLVELAAAGRVLRGRLDAAELAPRVGAALGRSPAEGELDYELAFAPAPGGAVAITGSLKARLVATCQRCLQPFELVVEVPLRLLVPEETGDAAETEGWDVADRGASPTLGELIEEELLLALPFLPRHAPAQCAGAAPGDSDEDEPRQRPFAGLREALGRDGH